MAITRGPLPGMVLLVVCSGLLLVLLLSTDSGMSRGAASLGAFSRSAPELNGGQEWINSEALTLQELRGKVVVVDFWTYGCINCRNVIPSLQGYWSKYRDQGLVIVGVHTPEFYSEHDVERVRQASADLGVTWPVVQDNDYAIWRAYRNNYWPHLYLIDKQGNIIYDHIGEGNYDEIDRQIQAALARE